MAALLSSPLAPTPKLNLFDQPNSPSRYNHDDLPADFDRSFGSSMSISDSLDGHASQDLPSLAFPPPPFLFGGSLGLAQSRASANKYQQHSVFRGIEPSKQQHQARLAPHPINSLGAAMGATFDARSSGLAAKMSSPIDMDISPAPIAPLVPQYRPSPSEALPRLMDNIHVGAQVEAGPSKDRLHPVLGGLPRARPVAERKSSLQLADSMSSRLFGAEIAFNSQSIFARDQELLSSPDKEPPPKRRPKSLPTRQSEANERISQLSSALMGVTSARPRPALSSTFANRDACFGAASSSSRPTSSFSAKTRLSDSSLTLGGPSSKLSSRIDSTGFFFEDDGEELGATQSHSQDNHRPMVNEPEHDGEEEDREGTNLSPSPSMHSASGTMAGLFFDPLSPEKLSRRLGMTPVEAPSLLAAMSSAAASPSVSSPPASSPCTRMPPPKRTTSLGTRTFERANTMAVVPRAASRSASGSGSSSNAGLGAFRTNLGKRANPYVKRPSLTNEHPALKSAYPVLGISGKTNRVVRPTAPAPRRCVSALDHSSILGGAGSAKHKLSCVSLDSPVSPDRRRSQLSSPSEMTDANGSPIAPSMRSRLQSNLMRHGSKDDSSPLPYGSGLKRSGSRGSDAMDDAVALEEASYTDSPSSAESLPGFGASEKEGKVLPCFNVKEDGLMRITPQTMTDLLAGKFANAIMDYQVVDCRFGYEYDGGHIPGALNLNTVEKVVGHFLTPGQGRHSNGQPLPQRSQSGKADEFGNRRKQIIVFHCEFSYKRAPSMALALRQADRALAHDYPNCHFPEIYILQGGYCNFFQSYANLCEPEQYIPMDDPRFLAKRSTELNGFRKQFSRHRSFTYGEGKRQSLSRVSSSRAPLRQSIQEEDDQQSMMEESPCPGGLPKLVVQSFAAEDARSHGGAPTTFAEAVSKLHGGRTEAGALTPAAEDTSFGSVGDSSFEDGVGDSPCAAAGNRKPAMILQPRVGSLGIGRRPLLRAGTTGDILPRYIA